MRFIAGVVKTASGTVIRQFHVGQKKMLGADLPFNIHSHVELTVVRVYSIFFCFGFSPPLIALGRLGKEKQTMNAVTIIQNNCTRK